MGGGGLSHTVFLSFFIYSFFVFRAFFFLSFFFSLLEIFAKETRSMVDNNECFVRLRKGGVKRGGKLGLFFLREYNW